MDWSGLSSIIIAVTTGAGLVTSYILGRRGQRVSEVQQQAANTLSERVQHFDELESINDRLEKEVARLEGQAERLRAEIGRIEESADRRQAAQAQRCRDQLDGMTAALASLRSVVLSEVVRASADDALEAAVDHVATDHPEALDA